MGHVMLKPSLEKFEHYFASVWDECNCTVVVTFFGIAFLWDWNENWHFADLCLLLNLLAYWVQHLKSIIFRIWNSSTGIPSPPLALFTVMLPKAYLTLYFRMSGSRCVITSSWLSGSWRSFLYSSSVYSCHLFLISYASVRSKPFLFYRAHLCMKCSLGISNFLEEISSLSHSVLFLYFFALITEEGLSLLAIHLPSNGCIFAFLLFSFAFGFSSFHSYL